MIRTTMSSPFGTLREMGLFLSLSVAICPLVVASLGTVMAPKLGGPDFRPSFQTMYVVLALGATLLTPILRFALTATKRPRDVRWQSGWESVLLLAALTGCVAALLGAPATVNPAAALLFAPLPFLAWAAVRLGVTGTAAALLCVVIVAVWRAAGQPLALHIALAVPFLLLAAATDELTANKQVEHSIRNVVRELTLLQDVTRVLQLDEPTSINDCLREVVNAIQRSWPHPRSIAVRARLGPLEANAGRLGERRWTHRASFSTADGRTGAIEVASVEDVADTGNVPFRIELLDAIAEMLRMTVDRRLVTIALRQSEQRYRSVVEHQSDLVCRFLADTTLTFVNEAYCRHFGKAREDLIGSRFIELIPESDRQEALRHIDVLSQGGQPHVYEHSVVLADGTIGRQQWIDHAILSSDGRIEELQGIGRDITDRWRAEEALRQKEASLRDAYERIRLLAHRLILAQEAERTEIARDLHDDISQQLAALTIGLSLVEARAAGGRDLGDDVAELRRVASQLADVVRHRSYALHPGVLKHAGLSAALASHCETVAAQHTLAVTFTADGNVDDVRDDVALCLYRVVQQALRNVVMHADASHATVTLCRRDGRIELTVADDGRGFDPSRAHVRGLGLMSIEERVHLTNGTFSVDSAPGGGARLTIELPVDPAV